MVTCETGNQTVHAALPARVRRNYLFLCRLLLERLRYLCFDIFLMRFFLIDPTLFLLRYFCFRESSTRLLYYLVERQFDDSFGTFLLQARD